MLKWLCVIIILTSSAFAGPDVPYPYFFEARDPQNEILPLHRGEEAFAARVNLIRVARERIEVEYYMFNRDTTGKILLNELIAAAKRGVKVRILLDKLMSLKAISSYYAQELKRHGIEVKYYNNASLAKIGTVQFRSHRKLLCVDDIFAITGGRNIGDEYFHLSKHLNYDDRDVLVGGPVVKAMRESFDAFYVDHISKAPNLKNKTKPEKIAKAQAFFQMTPEEVELRDHILAIGQDQLDDKTLFKCPVLTFASDAPGGTFFKVGSNKTYKERYRYLQSVLKEKMRAIDRRLTISSPYFITNKSTSALLRGLLKKNVEVVVHTNSLHSTDAIYMSANLYLHLKKWINRGIKFFLHDGSWSEDAFQENRVSLSTRWGLHAKTHIYETSEYSEVMIGSYNQDNRSDYYNTELAIFCKGNDDLTKDVQDDLDMRMRNGITITPKGKGIDREGNPIKATGTRLPRALLMNLITPPSWLFDFLL